MMHLKLTDLATKTSYTCLNCSVKFATYEGQRDHYKTDWHRYNLKRRVAELPPVTAEEFQRRIQQQQAEESGTSLYCVACRKNFNSEKAHANHLSSKKHKEALAHFQEGNGTEKAFTVTGESKNKKQEDTVEEVDSDGWDEDTENPIDNNNCLFCDHHSRDLVHNVRHMSVEHSFFIPDAEFCVDVVGLLSYLGEKISQGYICLWCNEKGKTFYTLDAVRKHMVDKGHCKMLHEGIALAEYSDFYDYSASYPDHEDGMDIDTDLNEAAGTPAGLDGDEYQLVLPSGAVIGHRSLMRYYKQRLDPNRALVHRPSGNSTSRLHHVLAEYRSLGWTATHQEAAARRARDIHAMKRKQSHLAMRLGVRANKLQTHYRAQVNF